MNYHTKCMCIKIADRLIMKRKRDFVSRLCPAFPSLCKARVREEGAEEQDLKCWLLCCCCAFPGVSRLDWSWMQQVTKQQRSAYLC